MSAAFEIAPSLAIFEILQLILLWVVHRHLQRKYDGDVVDFADQGPRWSVILHRIWIACHLPALALQLVVGKLSQAFRNGKDISFPPAVLHSVNFGLVLLAVSL